MPANACDLNNVHPVK